MDWLEKEGGENMVTEFFAIAIISILTLVVSYFVAKKYGRKAMAWFLAGAAFNLLVISLLVFLKYLRLGKYKRVSL